MGRTLVWLMFLCVAAHIGLAVAGWGGWHHLTGHPARAMACGLTVLLAVTAACTRVNMSAGRREDAANRWVFAPSMAIWLFLAFFPAFADRRQIGTFDSEAVRYVGLLALAVGGFLRLAPMFVLRHRFSGLVAIQRGHQLVTDGIYRHLRHPSYLGALLGLVGWVLVFRSAYGLVTCVPFAYLLNVRIQAEESMLASEFGEEYRDYQRRSWRLVPFVY
jgi:protein-S-isoprenylcysteine O-methyltransferase Ste14